MSEEFKVKIGAEADEASFSALEQRIQNMGKDSKVKVGVDVNDNGSANKTSQSIKQVEQSARSATNATKSFGDTVKRSLQIGTAAAITAKGFQLIDKTAREAVSQIKEIDKAITDLRMATGDSYSNVSNLVKGYNQMGQALGATTTEVTDSADAWLRQGKSISETNTLIKDSMILSKVGQIDSADATQYLTSAIKGYKVATEDVIGIVDKLTAVDLVSATDAGGLAEAISRTAVTADMAGVSMDKLIGYLATVGETTQKSMSTIGESFKTIFTRMSDIKSGKLELIDEDGTTETLSDVELTLSKVGIDLRKTVTEYNSYGEVLDNLALKWDSLSQLQQNALSKAFAGTRQAENFRALMKNYSTAQQYMETAMNSTGTAEEKFAAYTDSIEAKLKSLQDAFESLSMNTIGTDMLGGIIEASAAVVKFLDQTNLLKGALAGIAAVGAIQGITTLVTGLGNAAKKMAEFDTALRMMKTGSIDVDGMQKLLNITNQLSGSQLKAVLSSETLSASQRMAILTSRGMSIAEAEATLSTMGLATAEGAASASTFTLAGAVRGLWATLMANPLILVAAAVTAVVSAYSTYKQKLDETRQSMINNGNVAMENAESLESAYISYMKYAGESNLSSSEETAFQSAIDSVTSALGGKTSALADAAAGTDAYTESLKAAAQAEIENANIEAKKAKQAAKEALQDEAWSGWDGSHATLDLSGRTGIEEFVKAYDTVKDIMKDYIDMGTNGEELEPLNWDDDHKNMDALVDYYYKLKDVQNALAEDNNMDNDIYRDATSIIDGLSDSVENYVNASYNELKTNYEKTNGIPTAIEEYGAMRDSIMDASKATGLYKDELSSMLDEDFSDVFDLSSLNTGIEEAAEATEEQLSALKDSFKDNEIKDWFSQLPDEDQNKLAFNIDVETNDTTLWTLTKWKQELYDIQKTAGTSEESLQSFYDTMNNTEDGSFATDIDNNVSKLQTLQDALSKMDTGEMTETDKLNLVMDIPELAGKTGDFDSLRDAIAALIDTTNQGIDGTFESELEKLGGAGTTAGQALLSLKSIIDAIGKTGTSFNLDNEIEKFNNLYDAMKESVSGTGLSSQGIKNVEAMFSGLEGYDPTVLFERTENGIHLNTTALRALQAQYESSKKLGLQEDLQDLKQKYNDSQKAVEGLTEGTQEYYDALQKKGLDTPESILGQIQDVQNLQAQYEGLTSAYNKWIMAQSAGEEGDMYDNVTGSLEDIKKLYDDGLVGTNAFRSAVQLMTNEDLSTANIDQIVAAYEQGYPAMQRYFQEGSDGCIRFLQDVESLNSEWAHMNEDGSWEIDFGVGNDEEIANAISEMTGLQLSTEEVQMIMRKLSDYGFDINLDSAYTSVDELKSKIEESEAKLKELGQDPVDINVNAEDVDAEIENAKAKIEEIKNSDASVDVKTAQLEDANNKLDTLISKKIEASQPSFMSLDVSSVDASIAEVLGVLQEYQTAVNNLEALKLKGADTSEIEAAQGKVDELAGKIQGLDKETKVKVGLEADGSIDSIKSQIANDEVKIGVTADTSKATSEIANIEGEDVKVNVTTSGNEAINNLKSAIDNITDKTVTITANTVGSENVSGLKSATDTLVNKTVTATANAVGKENVSALKTAIDSLYNKTVTSTAKVVGTALVTGLKSAIDALYDRTVSVGASVFGTSAVRSLKNAIDNLYDKTVTATTVTKKVAGVDGTAHAQGTAFSQGDWGTKESGVALGGELGQELVVRNGKFFTIGDSAAEFFKYQKGDIIFNANQTKEIFEKGKITHGNGRGKALAEGTAFSSGSGGFNKPSKPSYSGGGGGGSNASSSGGSSAPSSGGSSSSSSSSSEEKKETFDWIEISINRIERAIDRLSQKAENVYQTFSSRNNALKQEMSEITNEINLQSQGYNRYMQQANSIGLSEGWASQVRNGSIDISTITDEGLIEQIKDYQEWYVIMPSYLATGGSCLFNCWNKRVYSYSS